jgi:hypothetical protein
MQSCCYAGCHYAECCGAYRVTQLETGSVNMQDI